VLGAGLGARRGQAGIPIRLPQAHHNEAICQNDRAKIGRRVRPSAHARRGCGGVPLDSPATFSAAFTGDAHFAADELQRRRFPGAPLLLAGFSMGALQAAKLLAELGAGERELSARHPALCALPCECVLSGVLGRSAFGAGWAE
jgi:pimeloyl-ACP methyl ester carboxylesterase